MGNSTNQNYEQATEALHSGKMISREGWENKNTLLFLRKDLNEETNEETESIKCMLGTSITTYEASREDMNATDWIIYND